MTCHYLCRGRYYLFRRAVCEQHENRRGQIWTKLSESKVYEELHREDWSGAQTHPECSDVQHTLYREDVCFFFFFLLFV